MDGSERVRRSRWVNKLEEMLDELQSHLESAPVPLPRLPIIDPKIIELLADMSNEDQPAEEEKPMTFLESGLGHQVSNRDRALKVTAMVLPGTAVVDKNTISTKDYGDCHFHAFTNIRGAMISSPGKNDYEFGDADWHQKKNTVMFRDARDGRCIVYVAPIEPLFKLRSAGKHIVAWDDIRKVAHETHVFRSAELLEKVAA